MEINNKIALIILDGWGVAPPGRGNAISLARIPNFDRLVREYPTMTLQASGEAVGLPWGKMGNSEVGHSNLGSGKVLYQDLPYINREISSGGFFKNKALLRAVKQTQDNKSNLHILGLVSNGGIHASIDHLFALLELCKKENLKNVFIHVFLDGRDTAKNSGLNFVTKLQEKIIELKVGQIATLTGRYWAMDRNNNWDRTEKAYLAIAEGRAEETARDSLKKISQYYNREVYDEEIPPTVIVDDHDEPLVKINDNDAVIFFNYRSERARQLSKALILPSFMKFERPREIQNLLVVSFTEYEANLPTVPAFFPEQVELPLSQVIAEKGLKQFHIAETEKYAHVTFFFNGGREEAFVGEDRAIIPSPQVSSYAERPDMSVKEIKDRVLQELTSKKYDFMIINFANPDMIGHTGNISAAIEALEIVDKCLGEVVQTILTLGGTAIVTADHGNCDEMIDLQTGETIKEHSTNPVPCILVGKIFSANKDLYPKVPDGDLSKLTPSGILSDVAPTILDIMGLEIPKVWTSRSLIKK